MFSLEEEREGVVLLVFLGNKIVKRFCFCGVNVLERDIDYNYKVY